MPYSLWILPLISGYFIINNYIYFKYQSQRLSSQRLIFQSIIAGIIAFLLLYAFRILLDWLFPNFIPAVYQTLYQLPIREQDFLWTSIIGFIITIAGVRIINWVYKKFDYFNWKKPLEYAVDEFGDELEQMFKQSAINKQLLQITLKNNKVYVGFAEKIKAPKLSNYLSIVPIMSGYRDSETKEIKLTTDYFDALDYYSENPDKYESFDMDTIVKQDEILTAVVFDPDIYEKFVEDTES